MHDPRSNIGSRQSLLGEELIDIDAEILTHNLGNVRAKERG